MRSGVRGMLQIERVNQPATDEREPDAIDDIPREIAIFCGRKCFGQGHERTELRYARVVRFAVGFDRELLALRELRDRHHRVAGQCGGGHHFDFGEHRCEGDFVRRRLFADEHRLRIGEDRVPQEGVQALKVLLFIRIDREVIVALATLEILAQKQPTDIARQPRIIDGVLAVILQPLRDEERRPTVRDIARIRTQHLLRHRVPRLVRCKRRFEVLRPIRMIAETFHEHHVKLVRHPFRVVGPCQ